MGVGERLLANPAVVLAELERQRQPRVGTGEASALGQEVARLKEREKWLECLYALGDVNEESVWADQAGVRRRRGLLEEEVKALRPVVPAIPEPRMDLVERACRAVAVWLNEVGG